MAARRELTVHTNKKNDNKIDYRAYSSNSYSNTCNVELSMHYVTWSNLHVVIYLRGTELIWFIDDLVDSR